jgi:thiol-disulfide isomerase/thioredoxin
MSAFLKRLLLAIPLLLLVNVVRAGVAAGDAPPDFLGQTRKGDDIRVRDMHGKVLVVAFWASWCQYCMKEFPVLANLQSLVSPAQLQVVAVNQDDRDLFVRLTRALAKVTPHVIYTRDRGPVGKAYDVTSIPRTLLIDRDGKVAYVHIGYDDDTLNDLANEINTLLAKPAGQAAPPQVASGGGA